MNVTKEAKRANGNSRACAKCPVLKAHKVCPETYMQVYSNSFVDGFKKGVKCHEQEAKKQIDDIKQKKHIAGRVRIGTAVIIVSAMLAARLKIVIMLKDLSN